MAKPHKRSKRDRKPNNNNLKPKPKPKPRRKTKSSKAKPKIHKPQPAPAELLLASSSQHQQLDFFLKHYQWANGIQLSSLEFESFTGECILKLSESVPQDTGNLSEHIKASFGSSWKEALCKNQLRGENSEPGSPTLLTISLSALRSLELLRNLKPFTRDCHAAKLFSKHLKIEDQVSCLKNHVNIACGTPSRIKKLIDMEALGLSRLAVVVLDMHPDVKGYSLLTLPQIRDEFWELYKTYFHQRLVDGNLRICLYGGTKPMNTTTTS